MKTRILDLLVCPACAGALRLETGAAVGGEVREGSLRCRGCARGYPITRGVPRLLAGPVAVEQRRTAAAFGWEWREFDRLHGDDRYVEQFLDWIQPLARDDFRGRIVVDAGCGMGRFAVTAARFGAREVLAFDLSDAVEAAAENARGDDNVHVIQADLHRLPLRRGPGEIDIIYSIGVLHHLPEPEAGFHALWPHLRPGGTMFAWVYGRENNGWLVRIVDPLRRLVFSRLPRPLLYVLAALVAAPLHLAVRTLYRGGGSGAPGWRRLLPYRAYLHWLSGFGFRHNHHVVFDHLVAPTAYYIRREEFQAWFARGGLVGVATSARNDNSWRGIGQTPPRAAPA